MIRGIVRNDMDVPSGFLGLFPKPDGNWYSKDDQGNVKAIGSLNPDAGADRSFKRKSALETTTSTSFITYDTLNVTNTDIGNKIFELIIDFRWSFSSAAQDFRGQILVDGVPRPDLEIRIEPKDGGGDQLNVGFCFDELELSPGAHTITLQYAGTGGNTARMANSRMRAMRIGSP